MKYLLKTHIHQHVLLLSDDNKHSQLSHGMGKRLAAGLILIGLSLLASAQSTVSGGSFIVNMGITPQTVNNGLKPYGLVYDLVKNYDVPVLWSINTSKAKDGTDFTYNSTAYKGGTFIIPGEYITAAVTSRITYWTGLGVQGSYATSDFSAPIYDTITAFPKMMLDTLSGNEAILSAYYTNSGIPTSSFRKGVPANLTDCYDLWSNPHADPDWSSHGFLNTFVTLYKGNIWSQCHTVSMLEGCKNSASPYQQLNFLTSNGLKCYANNKCDAVSETHGGNPDLPGTYHYPSDPMMQFMGTMDDATQKGSEKWFQPSSTGQWNNTTNRLITTGDGTSPGEGVLLVYGPAYGLSSNGSVMYTGGHDLNDNGTTAEKVAAQRSYFNFLFYTGSKKKLSVSANFPLALASGDSYPLSANITSGTGPYVYEWSSLRGGFIDNANTADAIYHAPIVERDTLDIIRLKVTDACGRVNFRLGYVTINHSVTLPIMLSYFDAAAVDNKYVLTNWNTASETNNDHFSIERSQDGVKFESVGQVKGAGSSSAVINYSFIDENPYNGLSYYRLKQTDFDKKTTISPAVTVKLSKVKLNVYPNPASSGESVMIDLKEMKSQEIAIQLFDMSGKRVLRKIIQLGDSQSKAQLNLAGIAAGTYTMTFSSESFFEKHNLVVY